jgi:hypothetical protein
MTIKLGRLLALSVLGCHLGTSAAETPRAPAAAASASSRDPVKVKPGAASSPVAPGVSQASAKKIEGRRVVKPPLATVPVAPRAEAPRKPPVIPAPPPVKSAEKPRTPPPVPVPPKPVPVPAPVPAPAPAPLPPPPPPTPPVKPPAPAPAPAPSSALPPPVPPVKPPAPPAAVPPNPPAATPPVVNVPPAVGWPVAGPLATIPADPPNFAAWERNMIRFGAMACDPAKIASLGAWDGNLWYYDGARVIHQVQAYTQDPSWAACADQILKVYRDQVVMPANGGVPGYRIFTQGLREQYVATRDPLSLQAIELLVTRGAYAARDPKSTLLWTSQCRRSREVAYNIESLLDGQALGTKLPYGTPPDPYVDSAIVHVNQMIGWLKDQTAPNPCEEQGDGYKPFMMALTAEALIKVHAKTGDPRIAPLLKEVALLTWQHAWDPAAGAFYYESNRKGPAPDLNLLIAPLYGWLYQQTNDTRFIAMGDEIFRQGVAKGYLGQGKQYSQNYRWSFDYIKWRK